MRFLLSRLKLAYFNLCVFTHFSGFFRQGHGNICWIDDSIARYPNSTLTNRKVCVFWNTARKLQMSYWNKAFFVYLLNLNIDNNKMCTLLNNYSINFQHFTSILLPETPLIPLSTELGIYRYLRSWWQLSFLPQYHQFWCKEPFPGLVQVSTSHPLYQLSWKRIDTRYNH